MQAAGDVMNCDPDRKAQVATRVERYKEWLWGPLRVAIGMLQMVLALLAGLSVLLVGLDQPITWLMIGAATTLMLASRLVYRGQRGPS